MLATETEKAEQLSAEVTHWKDEAANSSESVSALERKQEEMKKEKGEFHQTKRKMGKKINMLKDNITKLEKEREVLRDEANKLKEVLSYVGLSSGLEVRFKEEGAPFAESTKRFDRKDSILSTCS